MNNAESELTCIELLSRLQRESDAVRRLYEEDIALLNIAMQRTLTLKQIKNVMDVRAHLTNAEQPEDYGLVNNSEYVAFPSIKFRKCMCGKATCEAMFLDGTVKVQDEAGGFRYIPICPADHPPGALYDDVCRDIVDTLKQLPDYQIRLANMNSPNYTGPKA